MLRRLLWLLPAVLAVTPVFAGDWPQFRGPTAQGLADEQPVTEGANVRRLIALDARDGQLKWKKDRSGKASRNFSFSTPLVITVGGKKQIVSPASGMVGAYDPRTGDEIWKVTYDGYSVIPRPVYGH